MSFSSDVKEELSKINNLTRKNEIKYELLGYFISKNTIILIYIYKNKKRKMAGIHLSTMV